MISKKVSKFNSILLICISILIVLTVLIVKEINASTTQQILEGTTTIQGNTNIQGAEITIIDSNGNDVKSTTSDANGYYKIEGEIDTTKQYDAKVKLKYPNISFKCTKMTQKIYELGDRVETARVFNISSVIKQDDRYQDNLIYHQELSNKLKAMGNKVHVNFGTNINSGISNLGDELLRLDVTNIIICFGTLTEEEREQRRQQENSTGNIIEIIEIGDIRKPYEILEKLSESGYIKVTTNDITIENSTDGEYAYGRNIKVGNNIVLNCEFEQLEDVPDVPDTPDTPPDSGDGSNAVKITGEIKKEGSLINDIDGKVNLTVNDSAGNLKAGPFSIGSEYEVNVNLDTNTEYYVEYIFTEDAFNLGYSTQEYFINGVGSYNNGNNLITKTVKVDDLYDIGSGQTRRTKIQDLYKEIDEAKEQELDTYGDNTKLIARTEKFKIDEWTEFLPSGINTNKSTDKIKASLNLQQREKYSISLEKKVSGIKIVLEDGRTFLKEPQDNTTSVDFSGLDFKIIHMDDEVMHGATVYVEYTLKVIYDGTIEQVESVTVTDLLDDSNLNGGKLRNIYYDPNCELITEEGKTNNDYNWTVKEGNKEIEMVIERDKFNTPVKIITSQVITSDCEAAYKNSIYIEKYKTSTGRRNGVYNNYLKAGKDGNTLEQSEEVKILPPFGENMYIKRR